MQNYSEVTQYTIHSEKYQNFYVLPKAEGKACTVHLLRDARQADRYSPIDRDYTNTGRGSRSNSRVISCACLRAALKCIHTIVCAPISPFSTCT